VGQGPRPETQQLPIPAIPRDDVDVLVHLVELDESARFEARGSVSTAKLATLR
jgi:hypothetical protein